MQPIAALVAAVTLTLAGCATPDAHDHGAPDMMATHCAGRADAASGSAHSH